MAKRKKQPAKIQKRKGAKARPKARKLSNAMRGKAAAKRAVARAKPKRAPVKKAARKVKQPVAAAIETVAVQAIDQPAPGVITVTEVEETRQVSGAAGEDGAKLLQPVQPALTEVLRSSGTQHYGKKLTALHFANRRIDPRQTRCDCAVSLSQT